jgi:hypothetical protein
MNYFLEYPEGIITRWRIIFKDKAPFFLKKENQVLWVNSGIVLVNLPDYFAEYLPITSFVARALCIRHLRVISALCSVLLSLSIVTILLAILINSFK